MPRLKFLGTLALMTAMTAMQAHAAAPALPADVIGSDTIAVVHVDADHFNPDQIQSSATALLGNNAAKVDEPLKKFKDKFDKAAAAGATAITVVVGAQKKDVAPADGAAAPSSNSIAYITVKPGADVKAIEAMMTDDMKPEEKARTVFDQADNLLAVHEKDQAFPVKPDAERAALFADALGTISDASVQLAFIPDKSTRDEMVKNLNATPKGLKEIAPLVANGKWITLAVHLGNAPSLTATVNSVDAGDAKKLTDSINTSLADLKAQAANPGPDAGPLALFGPMVAPLLDGLKPTTNGTQVSVSVKTETLKTIVGFMAQFGLIGGRGPGGPPAQ